MKGMLLAKVDLLWNGGIGTYVKSLRPRPMPRSATAPTTPSGSTVAQLRCQGRRRGWQSRLHPARPDRGGPRTSVRINTDAIDNSAGVDTSDHEVNLKILLGDLVRDGDMTLKQRNALLADDDGRGRSQGAARQLRAERVCWATPGPSSWPMLPVHQRLIHHLEHPRRAGPWHRVPTRRRRDRRASSGWPRADVAGVRGARRLQQARPQGLVVGDVAWPTTRGSLAPWPDYFPSRIRAEHAGQLDRHPLKREIIINSVVNSLVNRGAA
jgi:glutamate dehydrogenase